MRSISYLWEDWRRTQSYEKLFQALPFIKVTEIHLQICRNLVKLLSDTSAEVVTSACKILGEIISKTSLWLDIEIFPFILSMDRQETLATLIPLAQDGHRIISTLLNSPKIPVNSPPSILPDRHFCS